MSDTFRTNPPEAPWSGSSRSGNGSHGAAHDAHHDRDHSNADGGGEVGKALMVGLLGGLVSAAGYFVYRRLPEEQQARLQSQMKSMIAARISEIRQNFNI